MQIHLSPYGQASSQPSPSPDDGRLRERFSRRRGHQPGYRYVNEKTIPVACLTEAMQAVANDGVKYRQAFNYGGPDGSANLVGLCAVPD